MKSTPNTLYVTQADSHLQKEGETVVVKKGKENVLQLPIHTISQIVCFGFTIYISPPLMSFCTENGVSITWLNENGKFLGRVEGPVKGNVLLRRAQYRWADSREKSLKIAQCVIAAKINNSRINLLRFLRNQPDCKEAHEIHKVVEKLGALLRQILSCNNAANLRGIEGEAASAYFSVFDHMILQQKQAFCFTGRNRRPPRDRINAVLSFLYTLLTLDIRSALETVGLDPYVGFLHTDRPGRPGLALDIVEEFRAPFADRLALNLINLKQIQADQFTIEGVQVSMSKESRKSLLCAYQNRKKEIMKHPFLDEKMEIGIILQTQARLLARYIRGDLDMYPAMIWR